MQATLSELIALRDAWQRLTSARPGETDFANFGYAGLNALTLKESIDALVVVVDAHVKKTKPADKAEMSLADGAAVRLLREIRSWVDSAQGNGFSWLITSTEFLIRLNSANSFLRQAIGRNVDLSARIARLAADQVHGNLTVVQDAAEAARAVLESKKRVDTSEEAISAAREAAESVKTEASTTLDDARSVAEELAKTKAEISQSSEDVRAAKLAIESAKTSAEADASLLQGSLSKLQGSVDSAVKRSDEAVSQLDAALRDARRQGLAAAFSERHFAARVEYFIWVGVFVIAIALLALLGWLQFQAFQKEALAASSSVAEFAIVSTATLTDGLMIAVRRLFGELPLAIPLIWLGWYSAKRISAISRLVQDYEYKAATALAFESYKNEVALLGGGDLSQQLLLTTIKNFGDNPVRLTDGNGGDHGHPMEALVDALKDEKAYDRFLKLIEKLRG